MLLLLLLLLSITYRKGLAFDDSAIGGCIYMSLGLLMGN
jgi:hypothetical protein